jgi:DNA-binding NtrC family response regulator
MASVLIVEDEPQVRVLAEEILQQAGYDTKTAANAIEARALFNADYRFDVLFTDVDLEPNGPNGFHVAKEAVSFQKDLKVIYTSAQSVTDGMRELQVEGSVIIPKPYVSADLIKALDELLGTRDTSSFKLRE